MTSGNQRAIEYRYFLTDLLTNSVISEVPFKSVSYERANRKAGSFSGTIPFIPATKALNLYEATMPGRTGLYITRNGVCVWGGVVWSRSYDVISKELSVDGSEFVSYFYHRNIWQTLVYGTDYVNVISYQITNNLATVKTDGQLVFSEGDVVEILGVGPALNGFYEITNVISSEFFNIQTSAGTIPNTDTSTGICRIAVDTYDFARDLILRMSDDLAGVDFVNDAVRPGRQLEGSVVSKERSGNLVTIKTENTHSLIPGQEIKLFEIDSNLDYNPDIAGSGIYRVLSVPDNRTVVFESSGPDIALTTLPGKKELNIVTKQAVGIGEVDPVTLGPRSESQATITTEANHGAVAGQTILVQGVDSFFSGRLDSVFNGQFEISYIPAANKIGYICPAVLDVADTPVDGGTVTLGSRFIYGDYGSYSYNSDTDILALFPDDGEKSGFYQETRYVLGFEQKSVGEILEEYSNNIGGFEYRIDCDYNYDTSSFERIFRLLKIDDFITTANGFVLRSALLGENDPESPEDITYPRSIEAYGAQNIVFEYPGNVSTFTVDESSENAATRFFAVGNDPEVSDGAYKPYSAAVASDLLDNQTGLSWPLLDQVETLDDVADQETLYQYAQDFLYESRPPIGEYKLSVNGSLDPQVGSYAPGEWCSIIIDDEFVRQRLESDQEPRSDIIIRKIESYKVSVPDAPNLPEKVDLVLIPDWKADRRGN